MKKKTPSKPKPVIRGKGPVPDLHLASWITGGTVRYIHHHQAFHLVLYVPADYRWESHPVTPSPSLPPPRFKEPSKWKLIFHQTAGYACHHRYLYARFLEPTAKIKRLGSALLEKYNDSLVSQPVSLQTANEYNNLLRRFGLSADNSYTQLEEGFYPIDIAHLKSVTAEKFGEDLRTDLIRPLPAYKKRSISDLLSNWVNFELAILGPNCD